MFTQIEDILPKLCHFLPIFFLKTKRLRGIYSKKKNEFIRNLLKLKCHTLYPTDTEG